VTDLAPAERLVHLAEAEIALVSAGRVEELPALHAQRDEALAALPVTIGDADRARLTHAHRLQTQAAALIERALSDTAAELSRLDRAHDAVRGYAASLKQS
jgi:hypothetical protein